ncbi:unnamed protein product [Didymodactylos carnosus]|uniref:Uncharacterized protein n=1 Tax=Didymodactylos carnosus TaxID=1234261 RepID=A0A814UMF1_9BILA|nr:unnamed protein product [Didymodactylos carnosus]CAF3940719.1 unnamed protein product [Didymodactylos carnosus]
MFRACPIIMFILRNMIYLNIDKQKEMIENVKKELKEVHQISHLELSEKQFKSVNDWLKQPIDIRTMIGSETNMIMIDSMKEMNEREDPGNIITEIMKDFIEIKENANGRSFCSKLDIMLKEQEELTNAPNDIDSNIQKRFEDDVTPFSDPFPDSPSV